MTQWIISLLMGALGGNIGGFILKKFSLGIVGNSIAGIIGGAGGMSLLNALGVSGGSGLVNQLAGGGVGGMMVMLIVGIIKSLISKK